MADILSITAQSAALLLAIWVAFRLVPSVPPEWKVWIWRLAFLKPMLALLPILTVPVRVLPPSSTVTSETVYGSTLVNASSGATDTAPALTAAPHPSVDPFTLFWLLGSGACLVLTLQKWHRAQQLLRVSDPICDPQIRHYSRDLCAKARVEEEPELLSSDLVHTAMLVASRKPTIVLPESALGAEQHEDARMMLAHELAHVARRDLAWLTLISLVQAVFFFNPMVWLAGRTCRLDHESATDRLAARLAGVSLPEYAGMLLRTSVVKRATLSVAALPATESYRSVQHRLKAMTHFTNQPTRGRRFATFAIALGTLSLIPFYQLAEAAPIQAKTSIAKKPAAKPETITIRATTEGDKDGVIIVTPSIGAKTAIADVNQKGKKPTYTLVRRKGTSKKGQQVYIYELRTTEGKKGVKLALMGDEKMQKAVSGANIIRVRGGAVRAESVDVKVIGAPKSGTASVNWVVPSSGKVTRVTGATIDADVEVVTAGTPSTLKTVESYGSFACENVNGVSKVKFEYRNFDLASAVKSLFRANDKEFRLEGNVRRLITTSVNDASFQEALDALVTAGHLKVIVSDGVYVISAA